MPMLNAGNRASISKRLRLAVKFHPVKQYVLAQAIGVDHSTLSGWLCGITPVRRGDPRVVELGELVGVSAQACFAKWPPEEVR